MRTYVSCGIDDKYIVTPLQLVQYSKHTIAVQLGRSRSLMAVTPPPSIKLQQYNAGSKRVITTVIVTLLELTVRTDLRSFGWYCLQRLRVTIHTVQ